MSKSQKKVLVFDLDGFLYNKANDLYNQPGKRIKSLINNYFPNMNDSEKNAIYVNLRRVYGNTLLGLKKVYELPYEISFPYVHDIQFEDFLTHTDVPTLLVQELSKKYDLYVLTAATEDYAHRFLSFAKMQNSFINVWGIDNYGYRPKSDPTIYKDFLEKFELKNMVVLMLDDAIENCKAALSAGFTGAIYLTYNDAKSYVKDRRITEIKSVFEIPNAIAKIVGIKLQNQEDTDNILNKEKTL